MLRLKMEEPGTQSLRRSRRLGCSVFSRLAREDLLEGHLRQVRRRRGLPDKQVVLRQLELFNVSLGCE